MKFTSFRNNNSNTTLEEFYNADSLFIEGVLSSDTNKINAAQNYSQLVFANAAPELNQQLFNKIYAHYKKQRRLDSLNLANLYTLAYLCPLKDGEAVFQARTLLSQFDTCKIFNLCEQLFLESQNTRIAGASNDQIKKSGFLVYPNPTSGLVYIKPISMGNVGGEFILMDLTGKLLSKYNVKANSVTEINCSQFESGLYLFKIIMEAEVLQNGKIIFIK